jgi:hypothetical protein
MGKLAAKLSELELFGCDVMMIAHPICCRNDPRPTPPPFSAPFSCDFSRGSNYDMCLTITWIFFRHITLPHSRHLASHCSLNDFFAPKRTTSVTSMISTRHHMHCLIVMLDRLESALY